MTSKRERYENANMRGGMGVRKRLSEESLRETYRLNGARTGFAVAKCNDRYGRWEGGYTLGLIVRKTAQTVFIRWAGDEDITHYSQGDARYEVDRQRWRILGPVQQSPLGAADPVADAVQQLRREIAQELPEEDLDMPSPDCDDKHMPQNAATPPTEETEAEMAERLSNAAAERAAAKNALKNGSLTERDTYTAKQVAIRCGTDSKTMRKFFRSKYSTVEPVGQGGRYEFDAKDLPKIKKEFDSWAKRGSKQQKPAPRIDPAQVQEAAKGSAAEDPDFTMEQVAAAIERAQEQEEPTEEELAELANIDLDLDDLDAEDIDD